MQARAFAATLGVLLCLLGLTAYTSLYAQERQETRKARALRRPGSGRSGGTSEPLTASSTTFTDAHVHLNDPDMQLRLMKESGNRRAIVFWGRNSTNDKLVTWAREHPDRLIPFASISPERSSYRKYWDGDGAELLEVLENHLKQGVVRGMMELARIRRARYAFSRTRFSRRRLQSASSVDAGHDGASAGLPVNVHCEITDGPIRK